MLIVRVIGFRAQFNFLTWITKGDLTATVSTVSVRVICTHYSYA